MIFYEVDLKVNSVKDVMAAAVGVTIWLRMSTSRGYAVG